MFSTIQTSSYKVKRKVFFSVKSSKQTIKRLFYTKRLLADKRIGPHPEAIIDTLVGSLLGDGFAEKRNNAVRFIVHMSEKNIEYVKSLHRLFSSNGYCSEITPRCHKQIRKNGKVYYSLKFKTWSFSSLCWLYDLFYCTSSNRKKVPENIYKYLTPRALSIWFMDDGGQCGEGVKLSTESFLYEEVVILQKALLKNFNLETTIQSHKDKYIIYFPKKVCPQLYHLIKPYLLPSMVYKFHKHSV